MNSESKFPVFGSPDWHSQREQVLAEIGSRQRALRIKLKLPAPTQAEIDRSDENLRIATYGQNPFGEM